MFVENLIFQFKLCLDIVIVEIIHTHTHIDYDIKNVNAN